MNKKKLFQPIDIIIYFNAFVFTTSGFTSFHTNVYVGVFFFFLALVNILFILSTIKLRKQFNDEFIRKIEIEIKAEKGIDDSKRETVNRAKKDLLESRIESEILDKIKGAKVIKNAYIPRADGNSSEIDLIVICQQGIFIIESKNTVGKITGSWKGDSLILSHPGGTDYPMINPIKQNTNHYEYLKNLLGLRSDLFRSVIVFGDLSYIENYRDIPFYAEVCKLETLVKAMNKLSNRFKTQLEEHLVNSTYETLLPFVQITQEKEKQHIERLTNNKK